MKIKVYKVKLELEVSAIDCEAAYIDTNNIVSAFNFDHRNNGAQLHILSNPEKVCINHNIGHNRNGSCSECGELDD